MNRKRVDIVTCAYNEAPVVDLFANTIISIIDKLPQYDFRIVVTNDGSSDETLKKLLAIREKDSRFEILNLSKNFGQEAAIFCSISHSTGDAVIVMDIDLQDPPELISSMLEKWSEGYDVVNAKRARRDTDLFLKRLTAKLFYRFINMLSDKIKIPENVGNFRLISRRVVDLVKILPEKNRVFRVLIPFLGFPTVSIAYVRPARPQGETHYNWTGMTKLAIDGITSATTIPLKFAIKLGLLISCLGFIYMTVIFFQALFFEGSVIQGWASTMSVILFLGGIQLIFLGVLGEYIGRIFLEVKGRPTFVVENKWQN